MPVADKKAFQAKFQSQLNLLLKEKASRTPAMRKMDTSLVFTLRSSRGEDFAKGLPKLRIANKTRIDGTIDVEINAAVSELLISRLKNLGGNVFGAYPRDNSINVRLPIRALESAALLPGVQSLSTPGGYLTNSGVKQTEGDKSMQSDDLRNLYGLTGRGVKIGVISDSNDKQEVSQTSKDLPATITVPNGNNGRPGTGEGTAMMEIVNDVAPGSPLYFNTANGGQAAFAQHYRDLFAAGCKVITDDVIYFAEPAFQDGPIAKAINDIWAAGGIVFTSAGNFGSTWAGTSGVWEGDWKASSNTNYVDSKGNVVKIQDWGNDNAFNAIRSTGSGVLTLQWNDPWGKATSDYDLYLTDFFGDITGFADSNNIGGNPYEQLESPSDFQWAIVVKSQGTDRVLRLSQLGGELGNNTTGQVWGHASAQNGIGVAAINAATQPQRPFNEADEPTSYSSDGLRRIYFDDTGKRIAPGLKYADAIIRQSPSISAPDGVQTNTAGFQPFYGTSAAAPHAAALTALLKEFAPDATPEDLLNGLMKGSIDILTPGYDITSGWGAVSGKGSIKILMESATKGVSPESSTVEGNASVTYTLDLGRKAPAKGLKLKVVASGNTDQFTFPATLTIPAGASTVSIVVGGGEEGNGVLNLDLRESYSNAQMGLVIARRAAASAQVASVEMTPAELFGGSRSVSGKVILVSAAPTTTVIELQSSNPVVASIPASVTISTNGTFKTFSIATTAVANDTTVKIRARRQGSSVAWTEGTLLVKAPLPNSCVPNPTSRVAGTPITYTLKLSGPAPTGGLTVGLATTDAAIIAVPRTVTFAVGESQKTFSVTAGPSQVKKTVTVSVRYQSQTTAQGRFTILVPEVTDFILSSSSVKGGTSVTGTVTLAKAAPAGGTLVTIGRTGSAITVPATVLVAVGKTTATFNVTTTKVTAKQVGKVYVKTAMVTKTVALTVNP
ncbi:hypothetical protein EON81_12640 [bacterium]|nr:MAG: hypothetical protein EON81_12640 [bacterium]